MLSVYPDKSRPLLPMGFKQGEQQQQWKLLEHKKGTRDAGIWWKLMVWMSDKIENFVISIPYAYS